MPAAGSGTMGDHQRRHAEDERERCHENWPEPFARRFDRGVPERGATHANLIGELHDQDGVLGRETHDRYQTDLKVDVAR